MNQKPKAEIRRAIAIIGLVLSGSVLGLSAPLVQAQGFPSRGIKIVVPLPPGGTTDVVARLFAQRMSEAMGQPVTVENRGGAGGSIGADVVAKAAPDGYTLLSNDRTLQYNYGSTGPGSFMNVVGESLKRDSKIDMAHVPFRGAAPLKLELLAGRVQVGGDQISSSLAEIRKGSLKALATNSSTRIAALPDVPTVRELGFPGIEANGWNGLFAPAKTPRDVIDRLQKEVAAALRNPELSKRLVDLAAEPVGSGPAELDAVLKAQLGQFRPIIAELKPTVE